MAVSPARRVPARAAACAILVAALVSALLAPESGAQAATTSRTWGVTMPGVPTDLSGLGQLAQSTGRSADVVMWYDAWATVPDFPSAGAAQVAATGATPEITWEPWDPARGTNQPTYQLARIAQGKLDSYIGRWATEIKAYGRPVILRFAHEMNGTWYPWDEGVNGNKAGTYVKAWRHVTDVFDGKGATNVTWLWSPNVPWTGSTPLPGLYPGDAYVDQVALDGYNWANLQPGSTWQSFWQVFGNGVGQVKAITTRPLFIGEVGCPEGGGDKSAWVTDMFATLAAHPEIRGVMWFDYDKEADWQVDSSPNSLSAFTTGLATYS